MKIDLPVEEGAQFFFKLEESFGEPGAWASVSESYEEIQIACGGIEVRTCRRSEQLQVGNTVSSAQFFNLRKAGQYFCVHILNYPGLRRNCQPFGRIASVIESERAETE